MVFSSRHHAQGDNSADSTDSRTYGPVPIALLQSVVVRKLWPLSDAGAIRDAPQAREIMARSWRVRFIRSRCEIYLKSM